LLVAKTPRDRQAELCDYLIEEESPHGNILSCQKNAKNVKKKRAKNTQNNAKNNAKKMRKKMRPNQSSKNKNKKKKQLTTEPPGGTPKNCSIPVSKAKFAP